MKNSHSGANPLDASESVLAGLFSGEAYEFQMRMRRRSVADYFRPSACAVVAISERRRWLEAAPERCFAFSADAEDLVKEAFAVLLGAGVLLPADLANVSEANTLFMEMGRQLDPDLVLLRPDREGNFSMVAGSVCFPSSWSLEEKIGRPLHEIHGPVPGLNEHLGPSIAQFLRRMSPGVAWCRENWGLSASPELNQHPSRSLPRLTEAATLDGVWLRVERQALVVLPETGGVLFAIRVEVTSLCDVAANAECRTGLRRALETMAEPIVLYKGLSAARRRLIDLLA